jgi:ABC-type transporter MlaC component
MNDNKLKNEFLSKLQASNSFKRLKPEEQAELLKAYENVPDTTYTTALKELADAETDTVHFTAIKKQKLEEQITLTKEIKEASRVMKKTNLEDSEQKEQGKSMDEANALLKGIGADPGKKRKKLFGIF